MILALLLLVGALEAQDVPPVLDEPIEEIVVTATYGRTTMLFDKGADGKLRNCRIMVSSGSQRVDQDACQATPVCYAPTADQVTDCVELTAVQPAIVPLPGLGAPVVRESATTFEMPRLLTPEKPRPLEVAGPSEPAVDPEADRLRLEKLPPPPTAPGSLPAIRITNAQDQ